MMRKDGRSIIRVLAHYGFGAAIALGIMGAAAGAQATTVKVKPDEAKLLRLADRPATVVVGNPLYADVMVVGKKVLVQGHNYGKTNVIILNNDGEKIAEFDVLVTGRPEEMVAVFRAGKQTTMFCSPECDAVADISNNNEQMMKYAMKVRMRDRLIKGSIDR